MTLDAEDIQAIAKEVAKEIYAMLPQVTYDEEKNRRDYYKAIKEGDSAIKDFLKMVARYRSDCEKER